MEKYDGEFSMSDDEIEYLRCNPVKFFRETDDHLCTYVLDKIGGDIQTFKYEKMAWPDSPLREFEKIHNVSPTPDTEVLMNTLMRLQKSYSWTDIARYLKFFRVEWYVPYYEKMDNLVWKEFKRVFPYGSFDYPDSYNDCAGCIIGWLGGIPTVELMQRVLDPARIHDEYWDPEKDVSIESEFDVITMSIEKLAKKGPIFFPGDFYDILNCWYNLYFRYDSDTIPNHVLNYRLTKILNAFPPRLKLHHEFPLLEFTYQTTYYPNLDGAIQHWYWNKLKKPIWNRQNHKAVATELFQNQTLTILMMQRHRYSLFSLHKDLVDKILGYVFVENLELVDDLIEDASCIFDEYLKEDYTTEKLNLFRIKYHIGSRSGRIGIRDAVFLSLGVPISDRSKTDHLNNLKSDLAHWGGVPIKIRDEILKRLRSCGAVPELRYDPYQSVGAVIMNYCNAYGIELADLWTGKRLLNADDMKIMVTDTSLHKDIVV